MKKHFLAISLAIVMAMPLAIPATANATPSNVASTVQIANPFQDIPVIVSGVTVGTIDITRFVVRQGNLFAQGVFTSLTGATENLLIPVQSLSATCSILDLDLGAIHLDLLGLVIDLSPIHLDITAQPGGGLLGDLLCGIANLLGGNNPIGNIARLLNQLLGAL
jgi:hypothetical protein